MKTFKHLRMQFLALILLFPVVLISMSCEEDGEEVPCTIGASCDDGDPATSNDIYNSACVCEGTAATSFTDPRDGQEYQTIQIGTQLWMAENLNFDTIGSTCILVPSNCDIYGRLYLFEWATDVCPDGWHLPTDAEWTTLENYLGPLDVGGKLKETGFDHWNSPNEGATNESGFTGLPGGYRSGGGSHIGFGDMGYFWSATAFDGQNGWSRNLNKNTANLTRAASSNSNGHSVRCIKD